MKDRLKELIEYLDLSQKDFANRIGLKPAMISDVISGRAKGFSNESLLSISEKFNVSLDWLLTGRGEMFLSVSPNTGNEKLDNLCRLLKENPEMISITEGFVRGSVSVKELLEAIDSLPEKKRRVALIQVRALAEC